MATKNINRLAQIVLPTITALVTLVLFLLFKPEETTALFWFNLCYTLLLEAVFFGWLAFLRCDVQGVSPWLSVTIGTYGLFYLLAGIVVMVAYAVLTAGVGLDIDFKWYIAVLLVITLLWCIPAIFMAETDSNHEARQQKLEANTQTVRNAVSEIEALARRHNGDEQEIARLVRDVKSLPPARLQKPDNAHTLQLVLDELQRGVDGGQIDFGKIAQYIESIKNN